jgi:SAM-dependent methyltransferase
MKKQPANLAKLFNEHISFPLRRKYLTQHLTPYLVDANSVLDLGASCGRLANKLSENLPGIDFIGIDTHLQSKTFIPIYEYDGKKIPFPDNSFDCVMIVDVIHHIKHPEIILEEVRRVTNKYILIKDHYWTNLFDLSLLKFWDYVGNKPYGVTLPYNFLQVCEWDELIKNLDLKIVSTKKFRCNMIDPCRQIIFHLEKTQDSQ